MPQPNLPLQTPATVLPSWKDLSRSAWCFPLLACFGLVLLFSAKTIASHDLGNHLRAGQWILQNHAFPRLESFTFTQTGREYQDPHGLFQIMIYFLEENLGYSSLTVMNMFLIFSVFFLLLIRLKNSIQSPGLAFFFLLGAVFMMERRFTVRPEIYSWFLLSLTLFILDLRLRGKDFLYLLPVTQLLWVNLEGLFVLGLFSMSAYLLSGGIHQKKWDPKLIRYSLFSIGADLFNPYFFKGLFFPLTLLTRFQNSNPYKQTIVEFFSPWKYLQTQKFVYDSHFQVLIFLFLVVLGSLLIFLRWGRWKTHEILLFTAFTSLAFSGVRNIPLFAIVASPLLANHVQHFISEKKWNSGKPVALVCGFLTILFALRVVTNSFYIDNRRSERFGLDLDKDQLPVRACEFLREKRLNGRILNDLGFGGWLNWKGLEPTFIDGRLEVMEDGFYQDYIRSAYGTGLQQLISKYQPDLILAEYNASYGWIGQLRADPRWRLIYLDECTALYAKEGYAGDIQAVLFPDLLAQRGISPTNDETLLVQLNQAFPSKVKTWFEGLVRPQRYPLGLSSMGLFCLRAGQYQAAKDFFSETLRQAGEGYEEIYFNLGVAYLHLQNYPLGRLCLERSLHLNPSNLSAQRMLESLKTP